MSTPASPKKGTPPAENGKELSAIQIAILEDSLENKVANSEYKVDLMTFNKILIYLTNGLGNIIKLQAEFCKAGKGNYLRFPVPDDKGGVTYWALNRKHLRTVQATLVKSIKSLKKYFRESKKKTREKVLPESFSGVYAPVYAGPAIQAFFTQAPGNFGLLYPSEPASEKNQPLMNYLTLASEGYLMRNTITLLFHVYKRAQGLQDKNDSRNIVPDDVMNTAFGRNIPALFYAYTINPDNTFANKNTKKAGAKNFKIPMEVAAQTEALGLGEELNSFDAVQLKDPNFDRRLFNAFNFQSIAALNYYPKTLIESSNDKVLVEVNNVLQNEERKEQMLGEHNLVKEVSKRWYDLLEPDRKTKRDQQKKAKGPKRAKRRQ